MEPRRIVLEPCGLVFALLGFGFITWTYYFFFSLPFLPLRMRMSLLCLSHRCILEAYDMFDSADSELKSHHIVFGS